MTERTMSSAAHRRLSDENLQPAGALCHDYSAHNNVCKWLAENDANETDRRSNRVVSCNTVIVTALSRGWGSLRNSMASAPVSVGSLASIASNEETCVQQEYNEEQEL